MATPLELLTSGSFGVGAGLLAGFLGIGGGAVLAPLLVLALGFEQHRAQGISLAALLPPVGLPALVAYRRRGVPVALRLVALLVVGFAMGAFGGAWLAHRVPGRELRWLFVAFLLVMAWRAATNARPDDPAVGAPRNHRVGLPIGVAAGVLAGLLGVGGGLIALPLLRRFARLSRLEAQATTLAMMLPPIGLPAVLVYAREQRGLPWDLLAVVGVGFALGGALGGRLATVVDATRARVAYAALLVVTAAILVPRG